MNGQTVVSLVAIAGALVLAVRGYRGGRTPKSWMLMAGMWLAILGGVWLAAKMLGA